MSTVDKNGWRSVVAKFNSRETADSFAEFVYRELDVIEEAFIETGTTLTGDKIAIVLYHKAPLVTDQSDEPVAEQLTREEMRGLWDTRPDQGIGTENV